MSDIVRALHDDLTDLLLCLAIDAKIEKIVKHVATYSNILREGNRSISDIRYLFKLLTGEYCNQYEIISPTGELLTHIDLEDIDYLFLIKQREFKWRDSLKK